MSYAPRQQPYEEKSHTGRNFLFGCLGGGCLLLVIGVGVVGYLVYSFVQDVKGVIEEEPRVEHYQPSEQEVAVLEKKAGKVKQAQARGEVIELVLTENDINTFIARELEEDDSVEAEMRPRVRFKIEGDLVSGSVSLPNKDPNTGKITYFNGEADFNVAVKDGKLELYVKDVRARGKKLPGILDTVVESAKKENLARDINTKPEHRDIQDKLKHCKKLEVKDGKVHVTIDFPDSDKPTKIDDEPTR